MMNKDLAFQDATANKLQAIDFAKPFFSADAYFKKKYYPESLGKDTLFALQTNSFLGKGDMVNLYFIFNSTVGRVTTRLKRKYLCFQEGEIELYFFPNKFGSITNLFVMVDEEDKIYYGFLEDMVVLLSGKVTITEVEIKEHLSLLVAKTDNSNSCNQKAFAKFQKEFAKGLIKLPYIECLTLPTANKDGIEMRTVHLVKEFLLVNFTHRFQVYCIPTGKDDGYIIVCRSKKKISAYYSLVNAERVFVKLCKSFFYEVFLADGNVHLSEQEFISNMKSKVKSRMKAIFHINASF